MSLVSSHGSYFFSVIYMAKKFLLAEGFVAAHTLPVLYERHEDQVDSFGHQVLDQLQHHYRKLDTGFLSKIPRGKIRVKKFE